MSNQIETWAQWPDEVRPTLRRWNHERRLRFTGTQDFKCLPVGHQAKGNRYGNAVLDGQEICDDCLIGIIRCSW